LGATESSYRLETSMKAHKHYAGPDYEIRLAKENKGFQLELVGQRIDEFRNLMRRAVNTQDPHKWPQWVRDLDEMFDGVEVA
jgi:hypothetical protein